MAVHDCAAPRPACRGGGRFVTRHVPATYSLPPPRLSGWSAGSCRSEPRLHRDKPDKPSGGHTLFTAAVLVTNPSTTPTSGGGVQHNPAHGDLVVRVP